MYIHTVVLRVIYIISCFFYFGSGPYWCLEAGVTCQCDFRNWLYNPGQLSHGVYPDDLMSNHKYVNFDGKILNSNKLPHGLQITWIWFPVFFLVSYSVWGIEQVLACRVEFICRFRNQLLRSKFLRRFQKHTRLTNLKPHPWLFESGRAKGKKWVRLPKWPPNTYMYIFT